VPPFTIRSEFRPAGDQPAAIEQLTAAVHGGEEHVTLLGATGTGKTFTIAHVVEQVQRPTLVIAPNKSLAAQLANEFREVFPDNAVEYFVSYYDYYQPEAYIPSTDTYIEKDSSVNDEIERLRHSATAALLGRRDVLIVASVSCIYGLGSPEEYEGQILRPYKGTEIPLEFAMQRLVDIQYSRNNMSRARGTFRVQGDTLEVFPPYDQTGYRIEWWGDTIEKISKFDPVTGELVDDQIVDLTIFPASHYVASDDRMKRAIGTIEEELHQRLAELESQSKLLEAERLRMRTAYDLEMMREVGFCSGIENYSRHIDGRSAGTAPYTLLDYFPDDYLVVIDESHVTVPQLGGMYEGDLSRKSTLVEHGFRLPSAIDNRPLKFEEFTERVHQTVYMSATPSAYELRMSPTVVEQIVRPTGLIDPEVQIRPTRARSTTSSRRSVGAPRPISGCSSPRSRRRWPRISPTISSRWAYGSGTCTPRSTPCSASRSCATCGWGSSTCSSASTCSVRVSTFRKSRSSRSSTPTRKASCDRRPRSCRRSGARPATSTAPC
jgi:excinuclease ABC subunit B